MCNICTHAHTNTHTPSFKWISLTANYTLWWSGQEGLWTFLCGLLEKWGSESSCEELLKILDGTEMHRQLWHVNSLKAQKYIWENRIDASQFSFLWPKVDTHWFIQNNYILLKQFDLGNLFSPFQVHMKICFETNYFKGKWFQYIFLVQQLLLLCKGRA